MNKKVSSELVGKKYFRRRFVTRLRVIRYGMINFMRNAWLTTAATAVMAITLLIIFSSVIARSVLIDTVDGVRERVDIPINLRYDIKESEVKRVINKIKTDKNVVDVKYTTLEENRDAFIKKAGLSAKELQTISELPEVPFFPSIRVVVKNPSDTNELAKIVKSDQEVKAALNKNPKLAPSFSGENRKIIDTISRWASIAESTGIIAGSIFVAISMLIIFNTIRMAIFNRREEIEMMKLIGADKNFIRGPFVVEAVMYGVIAAIVATGLGVGAFLSIEQKMQDYGIATANLHGMILNYLPIILLAMILIGSLIGSISSRLAVRRYLKV